MGKIKKPPKQLIMGLAREERGEISLPALFAAEDCGDYDEEAGGDEEFCNSPRRTKQPRDPVGRARDERVKNRKEHYIIPQNHPFVKGRFLLFLIFLA